MRANSFDILKSTGTNRINDQNRVAVVPEWVDGDTMQIANLSSELTGLQVRLDIPGDSSVHPVSPNVFAFTEASVSGLLFIGDDGDSIWFWPENESVAFRIEETLSRKLWSTLPEGVIFNISQGALIACSYVTSIDTVAFRFSAPSQMAA